MPSGVLMDTGPLVAYFSRRDRFHDWAVDNFTALDLPFVTCEPVLTEACFIAAHNGISPARILEVLARGGVMQIGLQLEDELVGVQALMERYANVPMSLADACLVRLVELTRLPICTLDSDFMIYRANGRTALNLILPAGTRGLHEP
jgi:predicted nucleic acid-binding protein